MGRLFEEALTGTQHDRIDQESQFVHQTELQKSSSKFAAAEHQNVAARH